MSKTMLVDATHPEETRVAIVEGTRLTDFDFERESKKQLKGNIYLAKVIRIEPSLQAAFVEYGGNRHGFLPFSEIHPDYFRIPMADRPHDEPLSEEDFEELQEDSTTQDELAAYSEYAAPSESSESPLITSPEFADHAPVLDISETEPSLSTEPLERSHASSEPAIAESTGPSPLESIHESVEGTHNGDLGLITDFGNAALGSMAESSLEPPPLETVGGEVAEVEPRERRQPRPRYKIQEVVKRRQVMLIQVVKEERGNKGAALTTFLSLAGRYCVLMPNTDHGGGVSRKITSHQDRRRMKEMLDQLEVPEGMAVILRTAGMEQEPAEIQRDLEYLLRLWNSIREETLQSTAPALIYEEANLIKRSLRDLYSNDLDSILVAGTRGYQLAADFMRTIMPDSLEKVKFYDDAVPLFFRHNVEKQIDQLYNPVVQLRSGGYIVINPTEALVSIDVNSGRATRERHIEGTALKTNLEAADEIARQLRLRDLAGLVVIDFIDMEDGRNNAAVERRLKEAMKADRARLQIGRISPFGLLELSRQRLHPSLMEINFERCPHCVGMGLVRSVDSAAISVLRLIEEEGIRNGGGDISLNIPTKVALYILNQKRAALSEIEQRYGLHVHLQDDDTLFPSDFKVERTRSTGHRERGPAVNTERVFADTERDLPAPPVLENTETIASEESSEPQETDERSNPPSPGRRRNRYGFGRNNRNRDRHVERDRQPSPPLVSDPNGNVQETAAGTEIEDNIGNVETAYARTNESGNDPDSQQRRPGRRRGRRGGRGRHGGNMGGGRSPRENDFQPRNNNWTSPTPEAPIRSYSDLPVSIPTSIHEIDTTPRDHKPSSTVGYTPPPPPPSNPTPTPYQVVSESSDKPKGGWWRRLTGQ